jgi:hypothetical protein
MKPRTAVHAGAHCFSGAQLGVLTYAPAPAPVPEQAPRRQAGLASDAPAVRALPPLRSAALARRSALPPLQGPHHDHRGPHAVPVRRAGAPLPGCAPAAARAACPPPVHAAPPACHASRRAAHVRHARAAAGACLALHALRCSPPSPLPAPPPACIVLMPVGAAAPEPRAWTLRGVRPREARRRGSLTSRAGCANAGPGAELTPRSPRAPPGVCRHRDRERRPLPPARRGGDRRAEPPPAAHDDHLSQPPDRAVRAGAHRAAAGRPQGARALRGGAAAVRTRLPAAGSLRRCLLGSWRRKAAAWLLAEEGSSIVMVCDKWKCATAAGAGRRARGRAARAAAAGIRRARGLARSPQIG